MLLSKNCARRRSHARDHALHSVRIGDRYGILKLKYSNILRVSRDLRSWRYAWARHGLNRAERRIIARRRRHWPERAPERADDPLTRLGRDGIPREGSALQTGWEGREGRRSLVHRRHDPHRLPTCGGGRAARCRAAEPSRARCHGAWYGGPASQRRRLVSLTEPAA